MKGGLYVEDPIKRKVYADQAKRIGASQDVLDVTARNLAGRRRRAARNQHAKFLRLSGSVTAVYTVCVCPSSQCKAHA